MISALKSAHLKLIRASENIRTIEQYSRRYARRKPHKIITDSKGKETADIRKAPPDDIAAGEVLYQLRSTLDHLRSISSSSIESELLCLRSGRRTVVFRSGLILQRSRLSMTVSRAVFLTVPKRHLHSSKVFSLITVEAAVGSAPPKHGMAGSFVKHRQTPAP